VELAKLERQRQDEVNQQVVDAQSAESEKDLIARQTEADAAAYEKTAASEAELAVAENNVKIAEQKVKVAELEKEAELESQKAYTDEYFRNKELDVQQAAAEAINSSVSTIITDSDGSGYGGLVGLQKVLEALDEE
jgi:chemotaxis response regulator CheB